MVIAKSLESKHKTKSKVNVGEYPVVKKTKLVKQNGQTVCWRFELCTKGNNSVFADLQSGFPYIYTVLIGENDKYYANSNHQTSSQSLISNFWKQHFISDIWHYPMAVLFPACVVGQDQSSGTAPFICRRLLCLGTGCTCLTDWSCWQICRQCNYSECFYFIKDLFSYFLCGEFCCQ